MREVDPCTAAVAAEDAFAEAEAAEEGRNRVEHPHPMGDHLDTSYEAAPQARATPRGRDADAAAGSAAVLESILLGQQSQLYHAAAAAHSGPEAYRRKDH